MGIGTFWLVPLAVAGGSVDVPSAERGALPDPVAAAAEADTPFSDVQFQVRERVIVRITPLSRVAPPVRMAVPEAEAPRRRPDRRAADCIPVGQIAGVRIGEGRDLLLYMRDRRVIGTQLDRSCQVSSFYSGFYVERPEDGLLCAGRDQLHARSGADCMLGEFHEVTGDDGE